MRSSKTVHIATIGRAHGIKGEVRVKALLDEPLSLSNYKPLRDEKSTIFRITRMRADKTMLVAKFQGINSRSEAEALNGTRLFVEKALLTKDLAEDEYLAADLIGLTVLDEARQPIGKVIAVPDFGSGDLLEIAPDDQEPSWYLALTAENVPVIDIEGGFVVVAPPQETQ